MTKTTQRPVYWTGVEAAFWHGGQIKIDWVMIDNFIECCGGNHLQAHFELMALAEDAMNRGEYENSAWVKAMAMACLNDGEGNVQATNTSIK